MPGMKFPKRPMTFPGYARKKWMRSGISTKKASRKQILSGTVDVQTYQEEIGNMDQQRTNRHNAIIANISVLNRLAEQSGLPPVYDGVISRDQPYRRQIADAVLNYVRDIILERP